MFPTFAKGRQMRATRAGAGPPFGLRHRRVKEEIVHPVRGVAGLSQGDGELGEMAHGMFHHLYETFLSGDAEFAPDEEFRGVFGRCALDPLFQQRECAMVDGEKLVERSMGKREEIGT